jgi:hypothetical protein
VKFRLFFIYLTAINDMSQARRIVARFLAAREFPSNKALEQYLKEHPKADKKFHWVKDEKKKPTGELEFIQDWNSSREETMKEYRTGSFKHTPLKGTLEKEHIGEIKKNALGVIRTYSRHLPGDDVNDLRDLVDTQKDLITEALEEGSLKKVDAEEVNKIVMRAVHDLVYQTHESYNRSLGDHGIKHIMGNINTQNNIFDALGKAEKKVPALSRLQAMLVQVNHDLGYTAAPAKAGLQYTGKHKEFSNDIFQSEYRDEYEKVFGEDDTDKVKDWIETHDSDNIDWEKDPVGSAVRVADNLSLYSKEKLPGLFRLIPGAIDSLEELGTAYREKNQEKGDEIRKKLDTMVDESKLNVALKKALKNSVSEISLKTAPFTLGMLGGKLGDISFTNNRLEVHIEKDGYDTRLQKMFDMGQKQFQKLAEAYGYTDKQIKKAEEFEFKREGKSVLRVQLVDPKKKKKTASKEPFEILFY